MNHIGALAAILLVGTLNNAKRNVFAQSASDDCKENGLVSSLPKIIVTSFKCVHLQYFFTAGPDEVGGCLV